jgi:rhodanese-related sulfurtransferase
MKTSWISLCAALLLAVPPAPAAADEPAAPLPVITPQELAEKLARPSPDVVVLDVRSAREFAAGHVPGAINVPHDELPAKLAGLAPLRDKALVLYCRSGRRTEIAAQSLRAAGFTRLSHLEGDFPAWENAQRPVETAPAEPASPATPANR